MRARRRIRLATAIVTTLVISAGCGAGKDAARFSADGAWARATPPGASTAAAYLTLTVARDDRLVGATVPAAVASSVEIPATMTGDGGAGGHVHSASGDDPSNETMHMEPRSAVRLRAGEPAVFEPGGRHFMLVGLASQLTTGTTFPMTLHFARGPDRTIDVPVRDNP